MPQTDYVLMNMNSYAKQPDLVIQSKTRQINIFNIDGKNIDKRVVGEFGEEWLKFNVFSDKLINAAAEEYFDIVDDSMVNKETYALDIGCGTGRWTKFLSAKAGFIEAVDPSDAIFAADKLLRDVPNVRLTKASVDTLPFPDETFDFAMSIGVLHHIPDTQQAMNDCVKKVKRGGHFYVYLYYNLDKRGWVFTSLFKLSDVLRSLICKLPGALKKVICDILAITIYLPLVLWVKILLFLGFTKFAKQMPLSAYHNKSFFVIRNDALDRFGTRLEQRFSAEQVTAMMKNAGLTNIIISPGVPYFHAVGKRG
ncbi:MAG: class I SAM-dependent methyltransferase [Ginsengibacter sp.]